MTEYDYSSTILANIKNTSNDVSYDECYRLCAMKANIDHLYIKTHQVVWGRRGTGKTTLLKAFTYYINNLKSNDNELSIYIFMAKMIPTDEEIKQVDELGKDLAVYVLKKVLIAICEQLGHYFEENQHTFSRKERSEFQDKYYDLDYDLKSQDFFQDVNISINEKQTKEITKEINGQVKFSVFDNLLRIFGLIRISKINEEEKKYTGKMRFYLDTSLISSKIEALLKLLKINHLFICLDEFSEIDKIITYSIQSNVAQLLKQMFFRSPLYTVKIATIWNKSKLHIRSLDQTIGLEYKEDIFEGPDLDTMFLDNNFAAIEFFKEIIINTFALTHPVEENEKESLSNYIIEKVFGEHRFRHIVCGSQGIARSFMALVGEYLRKYLKYKKTLSFDELYQLIIDQYLEKVRMKLPYSLDITKSINLFITNNKTRYFLITKSDYDRCENVIKGLASKNMFTQFPGHKTDRTLRDNYKLFLINYGNYLDALQSYAFRTGFKKLSEDSKLLNEGFLFPDISGSILTEPDKYTVHLPLGCENQYYCSKCGLIFSSEDKDIKCPKCNMPIYTNDDYEVL